MHKLRQRNREDHPVTSGITCAVTPEITVMAASGLWQDLREGLGQAESICNDLLESRQRAAWCGRIGRRVSSLDLAGLPWQNPRRGGEGP